MDVELKLLERGKIFPQPRDTNMNVEVGSVVNRSHGKKLLQVLKTVHLPVRGDRGWRINFASKLVEASLRIIGYAIRINDGYVVGVPSIALRQRSTIRPISPLVLRAVGPIASPQL